MIVAENWVWLHFPKCAGTTIEAVLHKNFSEDPSVAFDKIDLSNVIWHHNITARESFDPSFQLGERKVVCAIRRLPDWILSRVHFEAARKPHHHTASRELIEQGRFLSSDGKTASADAVIKGFSRPRVDHWLRVESLNADLKAFFGADLDTDIPPRNKTTIAYIKDRSFWFTPEQLERLYAANPVWAEVEKAVYGDLAL